MAVERFEIVRRALQAGADDYIVGTLDAAQVIDFMLKRSSRQTLGLKIQRCTVAV